MKNQTLADFVNFKLTCNQIQIIRNIIHLAVLYTESTYRFF